MRPVGQHDHAQLHLLRRQNQPARSLARVRGPRRKREFTEQTDAPANVNTGAKSQTERLQWPTPTPNRTTTTTWCRSEPVAARRLDQRLRHGRWRRDVDEGHGARPGSSSAGWSSSPASSAFSTPCSAGGRDVVKRGRARPSHARRAALAPLRHDPVHRLRGDVLRRLVLGLLRRQPLPRRGAQYRAHRNSPAATGRRRASRPSTPGICRC
jgi:hypothetical protein